MEINLNEKITFSKLISTSMAIYKRGFSKILNLNLIFILPMMVVSLFLFYRFMEKLKSVAGSFNSFENMSVLMALLADIGIAVIFLLILGVFFQIYYVALTRLVSGFIEGKEDELSIKESVKFAFKRTFSILITNIILVFMIYFGYLFCIIPGVILSVYLLFSVNAMAIDDKFYFKNIGRSMSIIKGNFWAVLGISILVSSLIGIIILIPSFIAMFASIIPFIIESFKSGGEYSSTIQIELMKIIYFVMIAFQFLGLILIYPIYNIVMTLKYLNLRNLKEGSSVLNELGTLNAADENAKV